MKKTAAALALSALFSGSALADKPLWCGYKDYFHINSSAHPGIFISNATSDGDVFLQVISARSFVIRDTPNCSNGYAHVTLVFNDSNWCVLDIKDGPFINHPSVHASCHGLQFQGMDYDGWGTHSYTINII
jgi:hypothetical protein